MRKIGVLALFILLQIVFAQNSSIPSQSSVDSGQKGKNITAQRQAMPCPMDTRPGCCAPMRNGFPQDWQCTEFMQGERGASGCYRPWQQFPGHQFPAKFMVFDLCFGLAILLFLLTINILLSILVSLDMKKRARFNGLWIPLLLIAGIPVSIIYALFRIGDAIREKNA